MSKIMEGELIKILWIVFFKLKTYYTKEKKN